MTNSELRETYNPEGSPLRRAQLRMLDMLTFIDKVCQDYDITYWLDSGTLLGAVRHGGFIPWDDDTDICMLKDDMLRFKRIMMEEHLSNEFVIQCKETDLNFHDNFIVLRDLKSEYIQDSEYHKSLKYRGLQVDILPLEDNIPFTLKKVFVWLRRVLVNKPNSSKRFFYRPIKPLTPFFDFVIIKVVLPLFERFGISRNRDLLLLSYRVPFCSKRYKHDIYPLKRIMFEGREFNAPNHTDRYLTELFGDWKPLPKEIKTHNVAFVFK